MSEYFIQTQQRNLYSDLRAFAGLKAKQLLLLDYNRNYLFPFIFCTHHVTATIRMFKINRAPPALLIVLEKDLVQILNKLFISLSLSSCLPYEHIEQGAVLSILSFSILHEHSCVFV